MNIVTLKNNHDSAIRQKTLPNSISTDNQADLLDSLADELLDRGVAQAVDTTALQALSGANYKNVIVKDDGIYIYKSSGTPNGTTIFAATGGGVYEKQFGAIQNLIVDTTYANLVTLINSSSLIIGLKYRITDFATRHFLIDRSAGLFGQDVNVTFTGDVEPLIVIAVAVNKIDKIAISESYPQDIIYYDWNPQNWLLDKGFSDVTNYDYIDPNTATIISNFKGVIYYRKDTIKNVEIGNDFRQVKYRSWKLNDLVWNSGTYNRNSVVTYSGHLYISMIDSNTNNTPTSFSTNKWAKITTHTSNTTEYLSNRSTGSPYNISNTPNSSEYEDNTMFKNYNSDGYIINKVRSVCSDDVYNFSYNGSILQNIVIRNNCSNVDLSASFEILIIEAFVSNLLSSSIYYSLISKVSNNIFSGSVGVSVLCGNISSNIFNYIFTSTLRDSTYNSEILYLQSSNFGCTNSTFKGNIDQCQSTRSFKRVICNEDLSNIDFITSATLVNGNYTKHIFKNSSGVLRLSYYNGSDVLTIANPTD